MSWFSDRSESRYIYNFDQYGAVVWLRTSISGSHDRSGTGWRDGRSAGWSAGRPGQIGRSVDLLVGRSAGGSVGWSADRSEARRILHTAFAYLRPSRMKQNASSPVFVARRANSEHDRRANCLSSRPSLAAVSGPRNAWPLDALKTTAGRFDKLYICIISTPHGLPQTASW